MQDSNLVRSKLTLGHASSASFQSIVLNIRVDVLLSSETDTASTTEAASSRCPLAWISVAIAVTPTKHNGAGN